jgi:hypothetical protein
MTQEPEPPRPPRDGRSRAESTLPRRRPGASPHAAPPPPPPDQPLAHPLPASLPRPLARPGEPVPPEAPAPGPASPAGVSPAGPGPVLPALPVRQRSAARPAIPLRPVTVTRLTSLSRLPSASPAGPVPAGSPPAREPPAPPRATSPLRPPQTAAPPRGARAGKAGSVPEAPPARRAAPAPAAPPARPRPARRALSAALAIAVCAGGAAAAIIIARHSGAPPGPAPAPPVLPAATQARQAAAAWVASQVSRSSIVACDPEMCAELQDRGEPVSDLLVMGTGAADPLGATVVVATPAVRSLLGARLAGVYAPAVLARFGAGTAEVDVRIVAQDGSAAAYETALTQDVQARRGVAGQLLANPRLLLSPQARAQVQAGQVDARLLITLPALAATHPVQVVDFTGAGPGADPGLPLCTAVLAVSPVPAGVRVSSAQYASWLLSYLNGQRPPFSARAGITQLSGGKEDITVEYSSPAPLGLLSNPPGGSG